MGIVATESGERQHNRANRSITLSAEGATAFGNLNLTADRLTLNVTDAIA